jgi:hypothetical protein
MSKINLYILAKPQQSAEEIEELTRAARRYLSIARPESEFESEEPSIKFCAGAPGVRKWIAALLMAGLVLGALVYCLSEGFSKAM